MQSRRTGLQPRGRRPVNGDSSPPDTSRKVGVGKKDAALSAPVGAGPVGERKNQIRGYSDRWKLVRTAPRCDFVLRVSQISLGNIYEKCQGEAGGWRSPLPSSTWLSTPNSSLTSQACEPVCVYVTDRVNVCASDRGVPCSWIKRHWKQKTRVARRFSSTFQYVFAGLVYWGHVFHVNPKTTQGNPASSDNTPYKPTNSFFMLEIKIAINALRNVQLELMKQLTSTINDNSEVRLTTTGGYRGLMHKTTSCSRFPTQSSTKTIVSACARRS